MLSRGESVTDTSDDDDVVTERGGGHRRCFCVDRAELATTMPTQGFVLIHTKTTTAVWAS